MRVAEQWNKREPQNFNVLHLAMQFRDLTSKYMKYLTAFCIYKPFWMAVQCVFSRRIPTLQSPNDQNYTPGLIINS